MALHKIRFNFWNLQNEFIYRIRIIIAHMETATAAAAVARMRIREYSNNNAMCKNEYVRETNENEHEAREIK